MVGQNPKQLITAPPTVAVLPCEGDYAEVLPRLICLAGAGGRIRAGESVLLKPNLHAVQHWTTGGTTNPALIVALIAWAQAQGASRVLVADSPFHSYPNPREVFTETGMAQAVEAAGAEWALLNDHDFRIFANASPWLPPEVGVSELVFSYDRLVNVAVMKTHIDTVVTLGMKNLKGCLRGRDKATFHSDFDISAAVVALNQLVQPDLTIVDGTLGMEGLGPAEGRPIRFGHILASTRTPAVDLVAARAMGFELQDIPMLKLSQQAGILQADKVRVVGEELAQIRRRFERPDEAMMRDLPGLKLQSSRACSACKLNLIRALCENADEGIPLPARLLVAGPGEVDVPEALLIGKCAQQADSDRPWLPGCPPPLPTVKEFLARYSPHPR